AGIMEAEVLVAAAVASGEAAQPAEAGAAVAGNGGLISPYYRYLPIIMINIYDLLYKGWDATM
ncbi:hypothetical protein, partial [Syntrophomonas wolfei]|uniref:hypothetical protein n=1 Tax=Syntrophomonas wolfei TaxID=863 RepID=UPI0023F0D543